MREEGEDEVAGAKRADNRIDGSVPHLGKSAARELTNRRIAPIPDYEMVSCVTELRYSWRMRLFGTFFAVYVFIFIYEFVFHGVLIKPWYEETMHLWRAEEDCVMPALMGGQILFAAALTGVYALGFKGSSLKDGLRYGGMLMAIFVPQHIMMHGVAPYPLKMTLGWIAGNGLEMILVGAILGALWKPKPAP